MEENMKIIFNSKELKDFREDNQDSNSNMYGIYSFDKDVIKNIEKKKRYFECK